MKSLSCVILLAAAFLAAQGCSGNKKEADGNTAANASVQNLKFESYTYDYIGRYEGSDTVPEPGSRYIRFVGQGVLPEDLGDANIRALRDSLLTLAGDEFVDDSEPKPIMGDSITLTDLNPAETDACGETVSTLAATLVTPRVVVWQCRVESYECMAAHGYSTTSYINYCLTDNRIIPLADLFMPGFEKQLTKLVRDKVKEMGISLLCQLSEIELSDQYEITTSGINFSYNPYQIAPFSEGTVSVPIELGDIVDMLSDHGRAILLGAA